MRTLESTIVVAALGLALVLSAGCDPGGGAGMNSKDGVVVEGDLLRAKTEGGLLLLAYDSGTAVLFGKEGYGPDRSQRSRLYKLVELDCPLCNPCKLADDCPWPGPPPRVKLQTEASWQKTLELGGVRGDPPLPVDPASRPDRDPAAAGQTPTP